MLTIGSLFSAALNSFQILSVICKLCHESTMSLAYGIKQCYVNLNNLNDQPLAELLEDNSVGESLTANSYTFQHTITSQLFKHQMGVQFSCLKARKR